MHDPVEGPRPSAGEAPSWRDQLGTRLTQPPATLVMIALITLTTLVAGALGYAAGLLFCLTVLWATRWDWAGFGLDSVRYLTGSGGRRWLAGTLLRALLWGALGFWLVETLLVPRVEDWTRAPQDLSAFAGLEGDLRAYLLFSLYMWVFAALGEEIVFRGFLMRRLALLMGGSRLAWLSAAIVSASVFGLAHAYQGPSGIITTGLVGLVLGLAFALERQNLLLCVLIHGLYDTVGITAIYLGLLDTTPPSP
jgi:membrane protease YdiL (CAAX protease family)